ncbi:phage virion morphogenesis protein [Bradyrhizobium sp. SZCCHNR3118]|uniref:phage virion morphogenesis protein n=1 Tax=Bradyrhizobium sp. SZCCHNR3118 TaxID=3057468 RepID=UPI002916A592|nr:phage virion morphogenesis protein [Bradyrhizobium sp. SZCCHNR3118]
MADFQIRMNTQSLGELNKRLAKLLQNAEHMEPVWRQAAEYMVRSTQNRINRIQTDPNGVPWERLAQLTVELKGNDWPLYATGKLVKGIQVADVNNNGFRIESTALNSDGEGYSTFLQHGVQNSRGKFKKKSGPHSPARPFMGFSKENVARISKMVRDHIASH